MSEQIAVRIPEQLAEELDDLVASGRFASKAQAIRSAILAMVEEEHRRAVGERIADGYRRAPQTDQDEAAAAETAIRSIHEEPW